MDALEMMNEHYPRRTLARLFSDLWRESATLIRNEAELAKAEISEKVSAVGTGIASLAVGGAVLFAGVSAGVIRRCLGSRAGIARATGSVARTADRRRHRALCGLDSAGSGPQQAQDRESETVAYRPVGSPGRGSREGAHLMSIDQMRKPEEIEAELDRIRARMDATLDEIEHRLTPRELIRDGIDSVARFEASRYFVGLAGLARRYPIPAALAGTGIAGLLVAGRRRLQPQLPGDGKSAGRLPQVAETAREKLFGTKQTISETAGAARAKLAGAMTSGMGRASDISGSARHQLRRSSSGVQTMARDRPVAAGAIGLAVLVAVAASVPYIRRKLL